MQRILIEINISDEPPSVLEDVRIASLAKQVNLTTFELEQLIDDLQETGEMGEDASSDESIDALATALQRLGTNVTEQPIEPSNEVRD